MPAIYLNSLDDPRLEPYRNLKATNLTRWSGLFVAEGEKVVRRLWASQYATESVLLSERAIDGLLALAPASAPVYVLPEQRLVELVGFQFHRGILAVGRRRTGPDLERLAPVDQALLTLVACHQVQDPENIGAILRSCAALGISGVLLGGNCADPWSRRSLRVSMGAALAIPIRQSEDLAGDLQKLNRHHRVEAIASVLDEQAEPLEIATRGPRMALLLGNEGHGLPADLQAICQRRVTISMGSGVDSLNVATAAGIFIHHFLRVPLTDRGSPIGANERAGTGPR